MYRAGVAGQRLADGLAGVRVHTRTELSQLVAIRVPSGLNATLDTQSWWPVRPADRRGWPVCASQASPAVN